jgi:predicted metal-dependent hydrolase
MSFTYNIVYSRRKSVAIVVNRDKSVTVRAPYFTSEKKIKKLITGKAEWIEKHIANQSARILTSPDEGYRDGTRLLYKGKSYILSIVPSANNHVQILSDKIEVSSKSVSEEKVKLQLERWYKKEATEFFSARIEELMARHSSLGFKPAALSVRAMKSRWGSCGRSGRITLNVELIKLEPKYTDYVILHELCHLKEMNHGKGFYELLGRVCPNYRSLRKELGQYRLW